MLIRTEIKNAQGEWVEGAPVEGEVYRQVIKTGERVIPAEVLPEHFDENGVQIAYPTPVIEDKLAYVEGTWVTPTPQPQETKITKLAMSNRFTFAENVAIETAAETDVSVRVVVKKLDLATYIDLSLPETEQLLSVLVTAGLINDARKVEILTTPIADSERYR